MCGPLTLKRLYARMAELEDAYDLGSYVSRRVGSSPTLGTIIPETKKVVLGGRCEDAHPVDDVKLCGHRGLIHGFTLSTTTDSTSCYGRRFPSNGWNLPDELTEICSERRKTTLIKMRAK